MLSQVSVPDITCPLKNQLPEKHHVTQTELLKRSENSTSVRGLVKANGEREGLITLVEKSKKAKSSMLPRVLSSA